MARMASLSDQPGDDRGMRARRSRQYSHPAAKLTGKTLKGNKFK